jgi:hypothetical protein
LSVEVRSALFRLADKGLTPAAIARLLGCSDDAVRKLLKRRRLGSTALLPGYAACGQHQCQALPWHDPLRQLRRERPGLGAGRLRIELRGLLAGQPLPSERAIQRLLKRDGVSPARPGRPPAACAARSRVPHHTWQMDAVEQEKIATGQEVSWLRLADEASGAVLQTVAFSPGALQPGAAGRGAADAADVL